MGTDPFFPGSVIPIIYLFSYAILFPISILAPMVLTRAYHLFIHNYIRSLLNIMLRQLVMLVQLLLIVYRKVSVPKKYYLKISKI